jgi:ketosteroid isomerase-like protein
MSDLGDFKSTFLARQAAAEEALIHGDLEPRLALWSRRDPLSLLGAARSATGWPDVLRIFQWVAGVLFGAGTKHADFRFDVLVAEVSADGAMAYSVGFERFNQLLDDGIKVPMEVRVTHVYRKEDGEWKIVHRHGSLPPVAADWPA